MAPRPRSPKPCPEHWQLIQALGGPSKVSEALEPLIGHRLRPQSISMWQGRGIPWDYRGPLMNLAVDRGIPVPAGFLGTQPAAAQA